MALTLKLSRGPLYGIAGVGGKQRVRAKKAGVKGVEEGRGGGWKGVGEGGGAGAQGGVKRQYMRMFGGAVRRSSTELRRLRVSKLFTEFGAFG